MKGTHITFSMTGGTGQIYLDGDRYSLVDSIGIRSKGRYHPRLPPPTANG